MSFKMFEPSEATQAKVDPTVVQEITLDLAVREWVGDHAQIPYNAAAEQAVLGSCLIDPHAIDVVSTLVVPDDFLIVVHRQVLTRMLTLAERGEEVNIISLSTLLEPEQLPYILSLVSATPTSVSVASYARTVAALARKRRLLLALQQGFRETLTPELDADEAQSRVEQKLFELGRSKLVQEYESTAEIAPRVFERLSHVWDHADELTGLSTGFLDLDTLTNGMQAGDLLYLAGRPSMGKSLGDLEPVLLADGTWTPISSLVPGDAVASIDGHPSRVIGVFSQGTLDLFNVTFCDGRSVECSADHLWTVYHRSWAAPKVLATKQIELLLKRESNRNRLWIDVPTGDWGLEEDLPIHPWVLGAYLGDGHDTGGKFSTPDPYILEKLQQHLGPTFTLPWRSNYDYGTTEPGSKTNSLRDALRQLGLGGKRSWEKFVPTVYMEASLDQRRLLLQGLLDTDGWVEKHGSVCFSSASERLADCVVALARSMGCVCEKKERGKTFTYKGERRNGRQAYHVTFSHENLRQFLSLPRKRGRVPDRRRIRRLSFRSVSPTRRGGATCIAVDHSSGTFLTRDYIATHNTALALNITHSVAIKAGFPVGIFSIEMSAESLYSRLIALNAGIAGRTIDTGKDQLTGRPMDQWERDKIVAGIGQIAEAPIYIDDTASINPLELRSKARRMHAQHNLKLLIVDYLQLMEGGGSGQGNRVQEVTYISRVLKSVARELSIPLLACVQLSRAPDLRKEHEPILSDLRESGGLEQDADIVMFVYRDVKYNPETVRPHVADVILAKQRNGPTGTIHLFFDEARMQFHDLNRSDDVPF